MIDIYDEQATWAVNAAIEAGHPDWAMQIAASYGPARLHRRAGGVRGLRSRFVGRR